MDITWHGHACVTIKGEDATIVCDPYEGLGNKLPKFKADIVTFGDALAEEKGTKVQVEGDPKILDWPGEFEVNGVAIEGVSASHSAKEGSQEGENVTVYVFVVDGIKICQLGGLSHELSVEALDRIGDVDVLLLPVGGGDVMDAKRAQKIMDTIEPRIVVPIYHSAAPSDLNISGSGEFLKLVGKTEQATESKLTIKGRSSLPEGIMIYTLLDPVS
jgi:L-ascorbate metabolism protein UlaG (beta-lactamase superfamily)